MKLIYLAAVSLFRNPLRSLLTMTGVAIAVVTFLLLRTVIWSWNVAAEQAVPDRVVTRHKVTFIMTLPSKYVEEVKTVPGVRAASWSNWWGGKEPNHPEEFFATFAVDPNTWFEVYDELVVPPEQVAAWKADRQGAIVGDLIAKKFGWKVGDTVTLESVIFEGSHSFRISGIYTVTRKTFDRQTFMFHWAYLNEMMPADQREQIGWIVSRTTESPAQVGRAIDAVFDEKDVQTVSQDEATFQRSFLAGFTAILSAIDIVSMVILVIMAMILGNTVAMGVRERTSEYGIMRAMGFLPSHMVILVIAEAAVLGLVGGVMGILAAYPVVEWGIGRFLEENVSGFFPYFRISAGNAAAGMLLACTLSVLASGVPAWRVSRLKIVDALRRVA